MINKIGNLNVIKKKCFDKVKPPKTRPSTLCIAAILSDQSFSGTRVDAIFSISLINSFSEYTLIGSTGFSVMSVSPLF